MPTTEIGSITKLNALYSSGDAVDTVGCEAVAFGAPSASTTAVTVTESDDNSTYSAVDADNLVVNDNDGVKALNVVTYSDSGSAYISYVGKKRYVKFAIANPVADTSLFVITGALRKCPLTS